MKIAASLLALVPLACASATAAPPTAPSTPASSSTPTPAPAAPEPAAATPASASAPAPTAPAKLACSATGKVVIRIEHRINNAPSVTDTLYATGAWDHDKLVDGKSVEHRAGCAAKAEVDQLDAGLRAAKFTVTTARVRCMAMSAESTVFIVGGKEVFTRQLCSGKSLDAHSQAQLDAATKLLNGEP